MINQENLNCRACSSGGLEVFIDFGKMPISNNYPTAEKLKDEFKWNMQMGFCRDCHMVQLTNFVPYELYIIPDATGKTQYAFYSSLSKAMTKHFAEFAQELQARFLKSGQRVADIGGNDGVMLQAYDPSMRLLNIEPSSNVAQKAREKGIETLEEFFTPDLARRLVANDGRFGAISSSNVVLNIHDLNGVVEGVETMLDNKGVFAMQDPYLGEILKDNAYDQVYDEHVWYFSLGSLQNLFARHGMEVFDAKLHPVHGGSMRVFAARKGDYARTPELDRLLEEENKAGMHTLKPYQEFAQRSAEKSRQLAELLRGLKAQGKRIVSYAAASKGTVILNYAGIGPETIDYVVDSTPDKQGRYLPGVHIPIVSPEHFRADKPDYALLGARNHAREIMSKEPEFLARGGRFIMPLPEPAII